MYPQIGETVSHKFITDPELLVNNLSFSHIREIMVIDDAVSESDLEQTLMDHLQEFILKEMKEMGI